MYTHTHRGAVLTVEVKGKLAHNFMVSYFYLVLISCLTGMARTYITEENAKINICCS